MVRNQLHPSSRVLQTPTVHINREEFLTKNLNKLCTKTQVQKAIVEGTLHAHSDCHLDSWQMQ